APRAEGRPKGPRTAPPTAPTADDRRPPSRCARRRARRRSARSSTGEPDSPTRAGGRARRPGPADGSPSGNRRRTPRRPVSPVESEDRRARRSPSPAPLESSGPLRVALGPHEQTQAERDRDRADEEGGPEVRPDAAEVRAVEQGGAYAADHVRRRRDARDRQPPLGHR